MLFTVRITVATLLIITVMLTDLPQRLRAQWRCTDVLGAIYGHDLKLCFTDPIVEVWAFSCRSGCLALEDAPGSEVRLDDMRGHAMPSRRVGEKVWFDLSGISDETPAVLSWKAHSIDSAAQLDFGGDWTPQKSRNTSSSGGRVQLQVIVNRFRGSMSLSLPFHPDAD